MDRSRTRRRLTWAALAAAVVVLLAAVALPYFIDVNSYRPLIQSHAERALGRPVSLGEMSLSLLPSIAIRIEDPAVEGLLRADQLRVGVRLLPLLRGSVELRYVGLTRPEVTLARRPDGTWDLGATETAPEAAPEPEPAAGAAEPARFSLSRLVVDKGTLQLSFLDGKGGAIRHQIALDLEGSLSGKGLSALEGEFDGRLSGEALDLEASGRFSRSPENGLALEIDLDDSRVALPALREILIAAGMSWPLPEGMIRSETLTASGRLSLGLPPGGPPRIGVKGARLTGAELSLRRDARGRWNVQKLFEPAPSQPSAALPAGPAPEIVVDDLEIDSARLSLLDETMNSAAGRPAAFDLSDVDLRVREMRPGQPIRLDLSAAMQDGGALNVSGTIPSSLTGTMPIDAKVTLDDIPLGRLGPYLASLTGVAAESGRLAANVKLSGAYPERVDAEGSLSLEDVVLAGRKRPITAGADFRLAALQGGARTEVDSLRARSGGSQVELKGWLDNREGATKVDLTVLPAKIKADDLLDILSVAGAAPPVQFSSDQPLELEARASGMITPRRHLSLTGRLAVAGATLHHPSMTAPMREVNGTVTLQGDGFSVSGFSARIGGSDIAGSLAVQDFDAPRATFQLASKRADFQELMSFLRQEPAPAPNAPPAPAAGARRGDDGPGILDALTARGTLAIGQGSFNTLDFKDLSSTLSLQGRVIRLDPIEMKTYGGAVSGSASMDMRSDPPVYAASTTVRSVDTDALLSDNLGMKGVLTGALSGRLSVSSSGASREHALRNAAGGGDIRLENGRVGPINVLGVLSRASDVLGEKSLQELSAKLAKEGTDFTSLTATVKVEKGEILTDNMKLISPDIEMKGDGTLHMLAGTIEISAQVILSEEISRAMAEERSKAAEYFWDSRLARVNLPLTMSGPLAAPRPSIDWSTASGNLARRKIEDRVREKLGGRSLEDLLGGRRTAPDPGREAASPGAAQPAGVDRSPTAGAPTIAVEEARFAGNILLPELKVKGSLRGAGLRSGKIVVAGEDGEPLHEEPLTPRIESYYASAPDPAAPASINFRLTLDTKDLKRLRSDLLVTITVQDSQGRSAEKTVRVER